MQSSFLPAGNGSRCWIEPGVTAARAPTGSRSGPAAGNTLFFLGAHGDYDLVVEVQAEGSSLTSFVNWSLSGGASSALTVRDDVRGKPRSSIKRLMVPFVYPPDQQPEAIRLVMEHMEPMAAVH